MRRPHSAKRQGELAGVTPHALVGKKGEIRASLIFLFKIFFRPPRPVRIIAAPGNVISRIHNFAGN